MKPKSLRKHSHHIDRRLRFRLQIYFLITIALLVILIFNLLRKTLEVDLGAAGLFAGVGIGIISSRIFHISWNRDAEKVVSRLDLFGIIILISYVAFEFFRERIVDFVTHGFEVGTVGFAVLAGIMLGRFFGTRGKILQILKEQEIFG